MKSLIREAPVCCDMADDNATTTEYDFPDDWAVHQTDDSVDIFTGETTTSVWELRDKDAIDGYRFFAVVSQAQSALHESAHKNYDDAVTAAISATQRHD